MPITKSMTAGDVIDDFVHSKDPKFAGDSKKQRIRRALAAYYKKQDESVEVVSEDRRSPYYHAAVEMEAHTHPHAVGGIRNWRKAVEAGGDEAEAFQKHLKGHHDEAKFKDILAKRNIMTESELPGLTYHRYNDMRRRMTPTEPKPESYSRDKVKRVDPDGKIREVPVSIPIKESAFPGGIVRVGHHVKIADRNHRYHGYSGRIVAKDLGEHGKDVRVRMFHNSDEVVFPRSKVRYQEKGVNESEGGHGMPGKIDPWEAARNHHQLNKLAAELLKKKEAKKKQQQQQVKESRYGAGLPVNLATHDTSTCRACQNLKKSGRFKTIGELQDHAKQFPHIHGSYATNTKGQKIKEESDMTQPTTTPTLVDYAMDKNALAFSESISSILAEKVAAALNAEKVAVQTKMFGEAVERQTAEREAGDASEQQTLDTLRQVDATAAVTSEEVISEKTGKQLHLRNVNREMDQAHEHEWITALRAKHGGPEHTKVETLAAKNGSPIVSNIYSTKNKKKILVGTWDHKHAMGSSKEVA